MTNDAALAAGLGLLVAVFGWALVQDWRDRTRPGAVVTGDAARRLLAPDVAGAEAQWGGRFPDALRALYAATERLLEADRDLVAPGRRFPPLHLEGFVPADAAAAAELQAEYAWARAGYAAFAVAHDGEYYLVETGKPVSPVYLYWHDAGTPDSLERVADALEDFLGWPRRPGGV